MRGHRLDKALIRFNEAVSSNKQLRQEIDDLRRERVVFESVYKRLERELQVSSLVCSNFKQPGVMAFARA